ncbi:DHBP synthase RibB-like alpha/beta domain-containing protein [Wolffia australiana]
MIAIRSSSSPLPWTMKPSSAPCGCSTAASSLSFRSSVAMALPSPHLRRFPRLLLPRDLVPYTSHSMSLLKRSPKRLKYSSQRLNKKGEGMLYVEVDPSGSDSWKLESVAELLKEGAVGVIPTDTVYAIVCDVRSPSSVERLRRIKGIEDSKPLSILCRSFRDIDTYSMGFPRGNDHGQTNIFRTVKQCLPGPYTFILPASKQLPKQCIKHGKATMCSWRKHVGVRMPDDAICQAILNMLDAPLICTSVKWPSKDQWILDPVIIADIYEPEGLDFVVDGGLRPADPSTIVDMTASSPTIVRQGKGPKLDWMVSEEDLPVAQVN